MVNELNKPPSQENQALGERLLASQRQLQEMQEEHRQLLQEMEILRHRAAELSRLNEQQFGNASGRRSVSDDSPNGNENRTNHQADGNMNGTANAVSIVSNATRNEEAVDQLADLTAATLDLSDTQTRVHFPQAHTVDNEEHEEAPETAEYLQKKLREVASLKARFKRVQNMITTTDLIEQHINTKCTQNNAATKRTSECAIDEVLGAENLSAVQSPPVSIAAISPANAAAVGHDIDTNIDVTKYQNPSEESEQTTGAQTSQAANEELLSTMMNMFSDFTADLRSQAEDLRAERDRLRALKEDLLRRKRQS